MTPRLRFEWHSFLKFVQLFLGRQFELLKAFRVDLFNLPRQPEALGEVETGDSDHHDYEQYFSQSLEIPNDADHCFTEKVSGAAQDKDPKETTAQRKKNKSH